MRTRCLVIIVTDHTAGQMNDNIEAILLKATQALTQILQLHAESSPTAATAGKGHITCVLWVLAKFTLTAIKGVGAIIATATLLHLLTLDNYNKLAHFTIP